jgi:hypothetical protein
VAGEKDGLKCRRKIEKSPLRQLEMSLPAPFLGDWELAFDDGFGDESYLEGFKTI